MIDIFEALTKDHEKVKSLLEQMTKAKVLHASRKALLDEFMDLLLPHSKAEEAVFYSALLDKSESKDAVAHSYEEHREIEKLLQQLQKADISDADWSEKGKKLKDALNHHIEEEESRVFGIARQVLSEEEAQKMVVPFQKAKDIALVPGEGNRNLDSVRTAVLKQLNSSGAPTNFTSVS